MEPKYTSRQIQELFYRIGMVIPMNIMGNIYDEMGMMAEDPKYADLLELLRDARGVWANNSVYAVGYPDDPNANTEHGL